MVGGFDPNPFDKGDEVNPFAEQGGGGRGGGNSNFGGDPFYTTSVLSATNSRLSPLPHEPADFYDRSAPVDIPLIRLRWGFLAFVPLIISINVVLIFYFVGFGLFCLESLLSIWVIQQVYMYFQGSGHAAEMKHEVVRSVVRAAI